MPPSSDQQIRFLVNLQRLLDEGQFVASYKFALLLALAELSIEQGDDSGGRLRRPTTTTSALIALAATSHRRTSSPAGDPCGARPEAGGSGSGESQVPGC